MNHSEGAAASSYQSAPDLSVEAIAHGIGSQNFAVPHHDVINDLHESHIAGKISDQELRQKLGSFFANKNHTLQTYEDQFIQSCATINPVSEHALHPEQYLHTAEQVADFLADPQGFSALQQVIEVRLADASHPPHEQLGWLDHMDHTINKMRSLITVLKYTTLHQMDVVEHFSLHKEFDAHHARLRAVHAHVRSKIQGLEQHREKLIKSQVVDQDSPHVAHMGHKTRAYAEYMDELSPVIAPGTPEQMTVLANPQKPQHPYQRELHHQAFAKIIAKMRRHSNNNEPPTWIARPAKHDGEA